MSNHEIQDYVNCVCKQIRWKNHRSAIRNELQGHIADSMDDFMGQGESEGEAIKKTFEELGSPQVIGKELNEVYKPEFDKGKLFFTGLFILFFYFLECYAAAGIIEDGSWIYGGFLKIVLGVVAALLLFFNNWLDRDNLNKTAFIVYGLACLLSVMLYICPVNEKSPALNAILLVFSFPMCCWGARLKDGKMIGFGGIAIIFLIPVLISLFVQMYACAVLLTLISFFNMFFIVKFNWLNIKRKHFLYIVVFVMAIVVLAGILAVKMRKVPVNINFFFVREYISKAKMLGMGNADIAAGVQLIDYPITLLAARFGFIILLIYFLFVMMLIREMIKTYKKQQSFLGKSIIAVIIFDWGMEILLSIVINLGIPLAKGISVPLLDYDWDIVVRILQLGLVLTLDCFGNYLFSDYSGSKLFVVEQGKIIIYYK